MENRELRVAICAIASNENLYLRDWVRWQQGELERLCQRASPEKPVFTLAEVHDEEKRDLAEGRKILVSSDAHRLWEISDGSFCVHLEVSPEDGEEAVRKALFALLEKKA